MGASPATGLVGMEQNVLLGDFCSCLGYTPLISTRDIRGAIVDIMSLGKQMHTSRPRASGDDSRLSLTPSRRDSRRRTLTNATRQSSYALICKFWCAVAMGGLAQGRSGRLVMRYVRLARDALSLCEGTAAVETVRALGMISVLYSFIGPDQENVSEYLERRIRMIEKLGVAGSTLMNEEFALFAQGLPSGNDVADRMKKVADFISLPNLRSRPAAIQFNNLSEESLCGRVVHHTSMVWRLVLNTVMEASEARTGYEVGERDSNSEDTDAQDDPIGSRHLSRPPPASQAHHGSRPPIYPALVEYAAFHREEIEQMKEASRRPPARWGIGVPLQGMLVATSAVKFDRKGVIEATRHCAECLLRFPGLGRFAAYHAVYTRTTLVLASIGDYTTYNKLAAGFNAQSLTGVPPIPPLEERLQSFLCDHGYCRLSELFLREHGYGAVIWSTLSKCLLGPRSGGSGGSGGFGGSGGQRIYESAVHEDQFSTTVASTYGDAPISSVSSIEGATSTAATVGITDPLAADDIIAASDWDFVSRTLAGDTRDPSDISAELWMAPDWKSMEAGLLDSSG